MYSRQITFSNPASSISTIDNLIRLPQSIQWRSPKSRKTIQLVNANISTRIPNIYNSNGFNNGFLSVSDDAFTTQTDIQLENGVYEVADIQSAINRTVSSWQTDIYNDPAFRLEINDVVGKVYMIIDSTKMVDPAKTFQIEFSDALATTLGFTQTLFVADGTYSAPNLAQLDTFGNFMNIEINGFGSISIINNQSTNVIASVDLTKTNGGNLYSITKNETVEIDINPPSQITTYEVKFTGSRLNRQIVLLEGECNCIFNLVEY